MPFQVVDIGGTRYSNDREPDQCPLCGHAIKAEETDSWQLVPDQGDSSGILEIVFSCPVQSCRRLLVARYRKWDQTRQTGTLISGSSDCSNVFLNRFLLSRSVLRFKRFHRRS